MVEQVQEKRSSKSFADLWVEKVLGKSSMLVAGFDPDDVLSKDEVRSLGKEYIDNVNQQAIAVKLNQKFYLNKLDVWSELAQYAQSKGLLVVADSKIIDIGNTAQKAIKFTRMSMFQAETFDSNTSGNEKYLVKEAGSLASIFTILMSNDEAVEKNKKDKDEVLKYLDRVLEAGASGVVIGATYANEGEVGQKVFRETLKSIKDFQEKTGKTILILVPGFGKQGGDVKKFLTAIKESGLDPKQCMINVGTSLMKPEMGTTTESQAQKFAKETAEFL